MATPEEIFHSPDYLEHNARRQEHLASLDLPIDGKFVLEVGAGIGDHTEFFLKRGCIVRSMEARQENCEVMRQRFPTVRVHDVDLDRFIPVFPSDLVYAYGILYHLKKPREAIEYFALCAPLLLLETCVDDKSEGPGLIAEGDSPSQAFSGMGCRPSRYWVWETLKDSYAHVYVTVTQPKHREFPVDWSLPKTEDLQRSVFVASQTPIDNSRLSDKLLEQHEVW